MKLLIRSTLAAVCLLALILAFVGLGAGAEPPADPPANQPTVPDSESLPQINCFIEAECTGAPWVFCTGTGTNCSTGSDPCSEGGCSGTRNFVICDGTKTSCSTCDVGSCCSASTTCSIGSPLSCTGTGSCQQGSESCTILDCNGTRNFVQCGSNKLTCACDIGSCKPCLHSTGCTPNAACTTQEECGPCGSCEFGGGSGGKCVCIRYGGP